MMDAMILQAGAGCAAAAAAWLAGPVVIPWLRKLKIGQSIREEGPESHQVKAGTPTMGGILILVGLIVALCFAGIPDKAALIVLISTLGFGLIGYMDDYIKVVKKRNLGLRAWQKILGQLAVSLVVSVMAAGLGTDLVVPFTELRVDAGWLYVPFVIFVLLATTNGVNLTDGLDGLAGGVTCIVLLFLGASAWRFGTPDTGILAAGLVGGCIGFLRYNLHPAKVFMGDTGSLALGGAVAALAIVMKLPLIIPLVGLIYVVETVSVILQVASFKTTGKRIFRMAPIHHHFELCGWKETKVVRVFWTITAVMAAVSWLSL